MAGLVEAALHERVIRAPISPRDPDFRQYLIGLIGRSPTERLHATYVGADRGYLADETLTDGTTSQVEGDLRRLLARAFDLGAQALILAHNHPSGSNEPSAEDIRLTRRIADITRSVDIALLDHLVVSHGGVVSMHDRGLI